MPRAERELESIYSVVDAEQSDAAFRWFRGLERPVFTLEETPSRCPVTPEDAHLRHLLYGKKPHVYRVIFEIDEPHKLVRVLSIRHGARQEFKSHELR
ncbi:MAG: type II toxin-antitoxin system RelE/ParE family toxin [Bryobacteraceae bacterium]